MHPPPSPAKEKEIVSLKLLLEKKNPNNGLRVEF